IRGQQPAQHPDAGGLAAAVGPEESEYLAALHPQRHVLDHVLVAEVLVQPVHVDRRPGVRGEDCGCAHRRITSTGWPGCSLPASAGCGRASTRNTSLERASLL